jgi:uncharacterized protein
MQNSLQPRFIDGILAHIAIPSLDLDKSESFYTNIIGAKLFRSYKDRRTFGIYNLQIVIHLSSADDIIWNPDVYPRHFGPTFQSYSQFMVLVDHCMEHQVSIVLPLQSRFPTSDEEHLTFILRDPFHNLVELKYYLNSSQAF